MPTVKYRISSRVSNGQAEVLVRFYDGSFSQRAKSHIPVPVASWDDSAGALVVPKRLTPETLALREKQHELDALADFIIDAWWREQYDARDGWLQRKIEAYNGRVSANKEERARVCECVREYMNEKNLEPQTKKHYEVLISDLERYEKQQGPLLLEEFTEDVVDAFAKFLQNERIVVNGEVRYNVRSRNTMSARLKKLSAVCRYAVSKGYIANSPFGVGKFKIQSEVYGEPIYLTIAERNALYEAALPKHLAVQRDIFVFQCHVGCRVSDLIGFTEENVTRDGWLQYIQHKLRKEKPIVVRVPLSDTALEIIERYRGCQADGRLLPFIHPNDYNKDIHAFCRLAGMDRIVMVQDPKTLSAVPKRLWEVASSHLARRTFMANVFKETGSERITSAFTGHVNGSHAFSRYTSVDDEMKVSVLKNMKERK